MMGRKGLGNRKLAKRVAVEQNPHSKGLMIDTRQSHKNYSISQALAIRKIIRRKPLSFPTTQIFNFPLTSSQRKSSGLGNQGKLNWALTTEPHYKQSSLSLPQNKRKTKKRTQNCIRRENDFRAISHQSLLRHFTQNCCKSRQVNWTKIEPRNLLVN